MSGTAESQRILYRIDGGVATITFNRPESRNATTPAMLQSLSDHLRAAESNDDVRAVVFRGNGEHFSSGGDVSTFSETLALTPLERGHAYERRLLAVVGLYTTLARFSKPLISLPRGAVAGAAISIVLASDFAVAGESCMFVFAHAGLGLCLDGALSYFLPRVVGWRKAKQLTLQGARLNAAEALRLGLVTEVVSDDAIDASCERLLLSLVRGPTLAFGASKRLLNASLGRSLEEQLAAEAAAVAECARTRDFAEGVRAFLEKRKASFEGK